MSVSVKETIEQSIASAQDRAKYYYDRQTKRSNFLETQREQSIANLNWLTATKPGKNRDDLIARTERSIEMYSNQITQHQTSTIKCKEEEKKALIELAALRYFLKAYDAQLIDVKFEAGEPVYVETHPKGC